MPTAGPPQASSTANDEAFATGSGLVSAAETVSSSSATSNFLPDQFRPSRPSFVNEAVQTTNRDALLDETLPTHNICSPMFQIGAAMQTANKNIYLFSATQDAFYIIDPLGFVLGGPFSIERSGRFKVPPESGGRPQLMPPVRVAWTEADDDRQSLLIDSVGVSR